MVVRRALWILAGMTVAATAAALLVWGTVSQEEVSLEPLEQGSLGDLSVASPGDPLTTEPEASSRSGFDALWFAGQTALRGVARRGPCLLVKSWEIRGHAVGQGPWQLYDFTDPGAAKQLPPEQGGSPPEALKACASKSASLPPHALSPQGSVLVWAWDGALHTLAASGPETPSTSPGMTPLPGGKQPRDLAFLDGDVLAVLQEDGRLGLWDWKLRREGRAAWLLAEDFRIEAHRGKYIAVRAADRGDAGIIRIDSPDLVAAKMLEFEAPVSSVALSASGCRTVALAQTAEIRCGLVALRGGTEFRWWSLVPTPIRALAFHGDEAVLAGGAEGLFLLEKGAQQPRRLASGLTAEVTTLAVAGDRVALGTAEQAFLGRIYDRRVRSDRYAEIWGIGSFVLAILGIVATLWR
jgi:hypothetical protein